LLRGPPPLVAGLGKRGTWGRRNLGDAATRMKKKYRKREDLFSGGRTFRSRKQV